MRSLYFLMVVLIPFAGIRAQDPTVISLSPSVTKMIYEVEGSAQLLGYTNYCDRAMEDGKAVVASQMNVNEEKILSLDPDLVITTSLTADRSVRALTSLGLKVVVLDMPESFGDLCDQLVDVGELVGKENKAKEIVRNQKARLERLQHKIPDNERPRLFIQLGAKPLFSVIPDTFLHDYIELAGGENIAAGLTHGSITRESVLARDPEAIFIVMIGAAGEEEKNNWLAYPELSAAESGKIFLLDDDDTASPTPEIFLNILEEIIERIYY